MQAQAELHAAKEQLQHAECELSGNAASSTAHWRAAHSAISHKMGALEAELKAAQATAADEAQRANVAALGHIAAQNATARVRLAQALPHLLPALRYRFIRTHHLDTY